ncbi:ubiquitin carboxyl-terminal hydrolase isoform X3 [Brevipalpus obovatus]|uniref:ubiquitin carboxyl-terminal hydrolase isoform X3 n=1 Tax=Brevipalpus obovatus TaxID=246614 RepID=UPI003D9F8E11
MATMNPISWLPLESNPDVMNKYIESLGIKSDWKFVDVFGFDDELLQMVPKPVHAMLLLYPCEIEDPPAPGTGDEPSKVDSSNVYYIRQVIRNACGAIAILHAVANNADKISFQPDSPMKAFIDKTKDLSPEQKAEVMMDSTELSEAHHECAKDGQTQAPDADASIDLHFVALVHRNGNLYELDGRKSGPVIHGKTSEESFLEDAAKVCKRFMEKNPVCMRFSAIALTNNAL